MSKQKADKKEKVTILKTDKIEDVVFKYPVAAEVMLDYGLHCVGCIASGFDTIEKGAKLHELTDEEIDEMVERVNEVINEDE